MATYVEQHAEQSLGQVDEILNNWQIKLLALFYATVPFLVGWVYAYVHIYIKISGVLSMKPLALTFGKQTISKSCNVWHNHLKLSLQ